MKNCSFQVCCPSCETHFEVNDPQLIGQIVACPKCAGMMLIEVPDKESDDSASDSKESAHGDSPAERASLENPASPQTSIAENDSQASQTFEKTALKAPSVIALESEASDEGEELPENISLKPDGSFKRSCSRFRLLILVGVVSGLFAAGIVLWGMLALEQEKNDLQSETNQEVAAEVNPNLRVDSNNVEEENALESCHSIESIEDATDIETGENADDISASLDMSDNTLWDDQSLITEDDSLQETSVDDVDDASLANDDEMEEPSLEGNDASTSSDEDVPTETDDELFVDFDVERFTKENAMQEETVEEEDSEVYPAPEEFEISLNDLPKLRGAPEPIDIDSRLQLPIRSIVFPKSPLASLRLLSEFSGVPFDVNLNAIIYLRESWNKSLDLKLEETTVFEALVKEAEMLHWRASKEDGRVLIEADVENDYAEQTFDFSELLNESGLLLVNMRDDRTGKEEALTIERLEDFIKTLAVCENREEDEGRSFEVKHEGTSLIVKGTLLERRQVEILLEQLRVLNGLPTSSGFVPEDLVPENRGWHFLSKKTPFNIAKPMSLQQAVEILETQFKFLTIWDDVTLNASGVGRFSYVRANFDDLSIDQILSSLLKPLKLTYLILDEQAIMITTKDKGNEYITTEIHGFTEPDSPLTLEEAVQFSEKMMKSVQADSWETTDSSLWLEVNSGTWFVKQPQPIQREIRRWTAGSIVRKNPQK